MPKGRKENLIDIRNRSTDVQREIRSMGGKAKASKEQRKKTFREQVNKVLHELLINNELLAASVPELAEDALKENTALEVIVAKVIAKVLKSGDLHDIQALMEITGESNDKQRDTQGDNKVTLEIIDLSGGEE